MRRHGRLEAAVISACLVLASCGETPIARPPNTTVTGVVKEIKRITPGCPKLVWAISGSCGGDYYSMIVTSDSSRSWIETIGISRVEEDDLRRIISQRITFSCYRDAGEKRQGCTGSVASIHWNGRELIKLPK